MGMFTDIKDSINRVLERLFAESDQKRIGIYGPPNAGKCLAPDEEVLLADGTYARIEDVFEQVQASCPDTRDISDEPHETWLVVPEHERVRVPALGDDLTVTGRDVTHVFRQRYGGTMYRVRTRLGREVTVSPEHPFVSVTEDGIEKVRAERLSEHQKVATLSSFTPEESDEWSLAEVPSLVSDGGQVVSESARPRSTRLPIPDLGRGENEVVENLTADWDEVVEIEEVHHDGYIYDLTVQQDHTFATRDGLVVHNTTLANRIARDWTGDAVGPESKVPHETRRTRRKENVEIKRNGKTVAIDIVDTPGVTTKVDYEDFMEYDLDEEEAIRRSREATEGVAEAMHWLREDVDGVLYVLDATEDPFTQVNTMLVGIIESRDLPVLILANKIDLEEANVKRINDAFPQHETIDLSALEGDNMDEVYDKIAETFG